MRRVESGEETLGLILSILPSLSLESGPCRPEAHLYVLEVATATIIPTLPIEAPYLYSVARTREGNLSWSEEWSRRIDPAVGKRMGINSALSKFKEALEMQHAKP